MWLLADVTREGATSLGSTALVVVPAGALPQGAVVATSLVPVERSNLPEETAKVELASSILFLRILNAKGSDLKLRARDGWVQVCFELDPILILQHDISDFCLASINSNNKWLCEDKDLVVSNRTASSACGRTQKTDYLSVLLKENEAAAEPTLPTVQGFTLPGGLRKKNLPIHSPNFPAPFDNGDDNSACATLIPIAAVMIASGAMLWTV